MTHPDYGQYDENASAYRGVVEAYDTAKRFNADSVFLVPYSTFTQHYLPTCQPNQFIQSSAGEVKFNSLPSTVIVSGGFFSACLRHTIIDTVGAWKTSGAKEMNLIVPLNAIYDRPYPFDGLRSDLKTTSYAQKIETYQEIMGTDKMTLAQEGPLMGKEIFMQRLRTFFRDEIDVGDNGTSKIEYPEDTKVNLKAHFYVRINKTFELGAFDEVLIQPKSTKRSLNIYIVNTVDGTLLNTLNIVSGVKYK